MLKRSYADAMCLTAVAVAVVFAIMLMTGFRFGLTPASSSPEYLMRLFDDKRVHTVDIQLEDWDAFLASAPMEEYVSCNLVVDGELFKSVGLRAKGNNSRSLIHKYGLSRYSLKIEFDKYVEGASYYGLDKFSLDASFQDNSYMKSYLAYDMMRHLGVPSPACSYVWVSVNGDPWGLFLAVEEPEESFAKRNFGPDHGLIYKPDYQRLENENADVALRYIGDDPVLYECIFSKAKLGCSDADKMRLISALKTLNMGENPESTVFVDETLRYFVVQTFVVNADSYLGPTGHNYLLYEKDGRIQMLPWDYNLAFGTYFLGMPDAVNDANMCVNYPIDTPAEGDVMMKRPLYHQLMQVPACFQAYHDHYEGFLASYFEKGVFEAKVAKTKQMIAPYVRKDPTAFCSYEDFELGAETIARFCLLRAESIRGQLSGEIPSTFAEQEADSSYVDASSIWIPDMGEIDDLKD